VRAVHSKAKRDDDDASGGAGGRPVMPVKQDAPLALNEALALRDIARNGGANVFVALPRTVQLVALARCVSAALIETQDQLDATRPRVRLLPAGVNRLTEAAAIIAAAPGPSA
jgi:hypothetical protein